MQLRTDSQEANPKGQVISRETFFKKHEERSATQVVLQPRIKEEEFLLLKAIKLHKSASCFLRIFSTS